MKIMTTALSLNALINRCFDYVNDATHFYKIDESHALKHSMDVFQNANEIYQAELCNYPFLKDQQKIIDNFNKLNSKKVSDFPKEIFIHKKFIDIYEKYKNSDIKEFIRMLSLYDIKIFYDIYDKLYKNLGLRHIKNKEYYLDL